MESSKRSIQSIGFINQSNTFYGNSILQILSVIPTFCNRVPLQWNTFITYDKSYQTQHASKKEFD